MMDTQSLSAPQSLLGEGPVWDERQQRIFWVDILNGLIHCYHPLTEAYRQWTVSGMLGAISLCQDGRLIAALRTGFAFVDLETGVVEPIVDPESHLPENRFNDGKCDPAGRFWAGTMSLSGKTGAGNLYVLDHELNCRKKKSGVTISNGLAWTAEGRTLYYIDTPTQVVAAFDYDPASAEISNQRNVIEIPDSEGFPDGMTIDTAGKLWIAHWDGWQVARWDPLSGEKLDSFRLPAARITSCTFGGKKLQDLYITSAKEGLSATQLEEQPKAGSLFVVKNCGYQGYPASRFKAEVF